MRRRKNQSKSSPHTFVLRPLQSSGTTVKVNFTPCSVIPESENKEYNKKKPARKLSITPRFNRDKKYYTACFINPFVFEDNEDSEMLASHQSRVRQSTQQTPLEQILVPKPRKGATCFCCVCRCYYEDYLEHVGSSNHKQRIRDTPFSRDIFELCNRIKMSRAEEEHQSGVLTRSAKRRLCQKFTQETQIMDQPTKKLILSQSSFSNSSRTIECFSRKKFHRQEIQGKRQLSTLPKSEALVPN